MDTPTVHQSLSAETVQLAEDILTAIDGQIAHCHELLADCHTILGAIDHLPDGGGYITHPAYAAIRPDLLWPRPARRGRI